MKEERTLIDNSKLIIDTDFMVSLQCIFKLTDKINLEGVI